MVEGPFQGIRCFIHSLSDMANTKSVCCLGVRFDWLGVERGIREGEPPS